VSNRDSLSLASPVGLWRASQAQGQKKIEEEKKEKEQKKREAVGWLDHSLASTPSFPVTELAFADRSMDRRGGEKGERRKGKDASPPRFDLQCLESQSAMHRVEKRH